MIIVPNQTFLHERDRYEPGTEYDVADADGTYFVRSGWADQPGRDDVAAPAASGDTVLDVHDATSNQEV